MKNVALACALTLPALPVWASDFCDDLWFTRNAVIDRAGHCFASALGRATFDNAGCSGTGVALDEDVATLVDDIRAFEAEFECKVDTSQTELDLDDIDIRRRLDVLPLRDSTESGCLGWKGGTTVLYGGLANDSPVVGRIRTGETLLYQHISEGDWQYVIVFGTNAAGYVSAGWLDPKDDADCENYAG